MLATRRSPLALAQTEQVARALRGRGYAVDLLTLVTTGDTWSAAGTAPAPDKGLFVKELEEALLDGRADLAVHSAKDMPAELPPGLGILAVPPREDPRDVLVGPPGGLDGLWPGARVATGSPRRRAQVLAARPEVTVVDIRGNVGTRLEKLRRGDADALVLAAAGLARLGLAPVGAAILPVDVCTPAPGQGCLAVEGRVDRPELAEVVAALDDPASHTCLRAERALLAALGGGCMAPIGALATAEDGGALRLVTFAGTADGVYSARAERLGRMDDPEALATGVAAALALPAERR